MEKKKNWIIAVLCGMIASLGIGFAALAQNLQINGTANIIGQWDIRITEIIQGPSSGASNVGTPSFDGTSATFEVDLIHPGAFAEFGIYLENNGNINAIMNSITGITAGNSSYPTEIQYGIQVLAPGACSFGGGTFGWADPLSTLNIPFNAGDKRCIRVRVEWSAEGGVDSVIPDVTSKTATINFNHVQAT